MQDADVRELQPLGTLYDERGRQAASGNEINHDAAFAVFPVVGAGAAAIVQYGYDDDISRITHHGGSCPSHLESISFHWRERRRSLRRHFISISL